MINIECENSRKLSMENSEAAQHDPQLSFSAICFLRNRFFPPSIPSVLDLPVNSSVLPSIFPIARKLSHEKLSTEILKKSSNISPLHFNTSLVPKRPRSEKKPIPENQKDERYFERRKRNNEAAKKSRDARKIREDRVSYLDSMKYYLRKEIVKLLFRTK